MAAKKAAKKRGSNAASLKRSTSRSRSRSNGLKRGVDPQPITEADTDQALGHGNQRALMARAQQQVGGPTGSPLFQDAAPLGKVELITSIDELIGSAPRPTTLKAANEAVTQAYFDILQAQLDSHIARVREALG